MLDWEIKEAVIGSLTLVLMVSIGSSLAHSKAGYADNNAANLGRVTAIPAAIIGTVISGYLIDTLGDIIIKILATLILIFVIERTTNQMRFNDKEHTQENKLIRKLPLWARAQIGPRTSQIGHKMNPYGPWARILDDL